MGKWSHYKKRYNKNWEKEAALRGWIASVPFDDLKAFCRYCRCELRAHHDDLISHAKTAKHKRSSEPFASSRIFNDIVASCANAIADSVDLELVPQVATCHPSAARPATVYYLRPIVRDISASGIVLGNQLNEGKTKIIFSVRDEPGLVLIQSKDRITAGDGARAHNLEGKARISTETTSDVFQLLNNAGIKTHFVRQQGEREFVARGCEMIPIEFVTRRIATGSFLKRNPGVPEGFRFCPPKLEFFFKDDANHDPQWSYEQIISAKMKFRDIEIGATELDIICKTTVCVFEILERAWASLDCALIDMKIEFGVDIENQEIVLADIIDSDSWRLWPSGDRRLMKDKQVYRELAEVTPEALEIVKKNFAWIGEKVKVLAERQSTGRVVVLMGSSSDKEFGKKIQNQCLTFGIECVLRVTSAHKGPDSTLKIVAEYEGDGIPTVFVAVAGRSNGLGPVVSGSTTYPVINCPPLSGEWGPHDLWSSVRLPSGLGCSTVLSPEAAALQAAQIFAVSDHVVWGKLRASQLNRWIGLRRDDSDCCN